MSPDEIRAHLGAGPPADPTLGLLPDAGGWPGHNLDPVQVEGLKEYLGATSWWQVHADQHVSRSHGSYGHQHADEDVPPFLLGLTPVRETADDPEAGGPAGEDQAEAEAPAGPPSSAEVDARVAGLFDQPPPPPPPGDADAAAAAAPWPFDQPDQAEAAARAGEDMAKALLKGPDEVTVTQAQVTRYLLAEVLAAGDADAILVQRRGVGLRELVGRDVRIARVAWFFSAEGEDPGLYVIADATLGEGGEHVALVVASRTALAQLLALEAADGFPVDVRVEAAPQVRPDGSSAVWLVAPPPPPGF